MLAADGRYSQADASGHAGSSASAPASSPPASVIPAATLPTPPTAITAHTPRRSRSSSTPPARASRHPGILSRSTTRPRSTVRATTSASATLRDLLREPRSRSASLKTRSQTSKPPPPGPARSSPKSNPSAPSGKPSPNTRTIWKSTRKGTPATSRDRTGSCRSELGRRRAREPSPKTNVLNFRRGTACLKPANAHSKPDPAPVRSMAATGPKALPTTQTPRS